VLEVNTRATATTTASFLGTIVARTPFPVRAIQVDGGRSSRQTLNGPGQERVIRLFTLPPRSPEVNGCVERAQRTHQEEFYEVYFGDLEITSLTTALQDWECAYNSMQPHQSLGYLTPYQFITRWQNRQREEAKCH